MEFSLAQIKPISTEYAETVHGLTYLGGGFRVLIQAAGEDATEVVALGAKAVCACVRQIVSRSVERLSACQQACICRVESAVHATGLCSCVAEVCEVRVRRR